MGIFKKIKKAAKNVVKGVKKVFKKATKFVGKVMGSKWGKRLMIAAAVFSVGMGVAAFAGAWGAQASGATFMTKFVAGSKAFAGALMNPVGAAKGAFGAAPGTGLTGFTQGAAQGQGIFDVGAAVSGAQNASPAAQAGGSLTEQIAGKAGIQAPGPGLSSPVTTPQPSIVDTMMSNAGKLASAPTGGGGGTGWLSNVLGGAKDIAMSPGFGLVAGQMIQGYGQGKIAEDMLEHGDYMDRQWADPRKRALLEEAGSTGPGFNRQGYLERARLFQEESARGGQAGSRQSIGYAPAPRR
jgi:hypothetical protein